LRRSVDGYSGEHGDSREEETDMSTHESKAGSEEMKGVDQTRRALIRAGWVIPAVLALQLQLPSTAVAQYAHVDAAAHVDASAHVDAAVGATP
jgi:hypothetical protein